MMRLCINVNIFSLQKREIRNAVVSACGSMLNRPLLSIVAVIFLSTIVVQQVVLQDVSKQSPITTAFIVGRPFSTTTASGYASSCLNVGFPCVVISYHGSVYSEFGTCTATPRGSPRCYPKAGYVFLILMVSFWNNGYDTAPTGPQSGLKYVSYFHLAVGESSQYDPIYLSCMSSNTLLPITDVLNGRSVHGYLAFEIPTNFKSYSLIYKPETGSYNVLYSDEGFTTATA
jgi:hypothetical protein